MFTFGVILFAGCFAEPITEEMVKEKLLADFKQNNSTQGRYGWELEGKGSWFVGNDFKVKCLDEAGLVYPDHDRRAEDDIKISPMLAAQHYITASTKRGFCIDMGSDLNLQINSVKDRAESSSEINIFEVQVEYTINNPTPWFGCLSDSTLSRMIVVEDKDLKR